MRNQDFTEALKRLDTLSEVLLPIREEVAELERERKRAEWLTLVQQMAQVHP